jgi:spore coat polysaccharide biosynthesis predicted glycosyltransferase SpsG
MYDADLAIGAAGSSVWERCCLGLPQVLMVTADNQREIFKNLIALNICYQVKDLTHVLKKDFIAFGENLGFINGGNGVSRVMQLVAQ